jgi:hypothetical protein
MVAIDGSLLRRSTCIGGRVGIAVGIDAGEFSLEKVNYALCAVSKLTFSHVLHGHKPLHLRLSARLLNTHATGNDDSGTIGRLLAIATYGRDRGDSMWTQCGIVTRNSCNKMDSQFSPTCLARKLSPTRN